MDIASLDVLLAGLGSNKLFTGLAMLIMNLGSRYIIMDIGASYDKVFNTVLVKQIIVFCMFFASTRDVKLAGILTFAFWLIVMGLLDKRRPLNVMPSFMGVGAEDETSTGAAQMYMAGINALVAKNE